MSYPIVEQFLVSFIIRFFFVFGIIGFAVGIGLIFSSERMHQLFGKMNHWVSVRRCTRWLAIPRDSGLAVQQYRRLIGLIFVVLAAISSFVLVRQLDVAKVVAAFRIEAPSSFVAWILESLYWFLIAGNMVAIVVGIMLISFPGALRLIETRANQWHSTRNISRSGDTMHMAFDNWIESYPRVMGGIIAVAAFLVVADYGMLLFGRS